MKKVAFYTLGCKVNQYESEAISGTFSKEGYEIVDFDEAADVYIINTCTVTNLSDKKSRQMIRRAKKSNKDSIVVVTGCYAQMSPDEVKNILGVDLIVGTKDRNKIIEYVKDIQGRKITRDTYTDKNVFVDDIMAAKEFEELQVDAYKERTRAFIKIQDGCSQYCSYCVIPYARGPVRSRYPEAVLAEVKRLADSGYKEIVLTGIHIASYGKDIKNTSLIDIIKKVHEIKPIERIRLGSIEPTTITDEFVDMAVRLKKLCPHYHVSLQSGCDKILAMMNRKYTVNDYEKMAGLLLDRISDVALTTDVMVGFPGETDEDFEQTYKFISGIPFAKMHIFRYSPRKGTPAAALNAQVSDREKNERSNRLIELSEKKSIEFNSKHVGRIVPVLFEQDVKGKEGIIEGLTTNYIRVLCEGNEGLKGQILNVRLTKAEKDYMSGVLHK